MSEEQALSPEGYAKSRVRTYSLNSYEQIYRGGEWFQIFLIVKWQLFWVLDQA